MLPYFSEEAIAGAIPISLVTARGYAGWRKAQPRRVRDWLSQVGFRAVPGRHAAIPSSGEGAAALAGVLACIGTPAEPWDVGALPAALRRGTYRIDTDLDGATATALCIGWGLGTYTFTRYKPGAAKLFATLEVPSACDVGQARRAIAATFFARDLINTPAEDLGPAELADAALAMARPLRARARVIAGEDLLAGNLPAIHAVGRASPRAPRLIDLRWGRRSAPRLTLVGKGVCFDTGGLNIKPAAGMRLMKKDMGGSAVVLGLAHMIMDAGLDVRLRVLIPAVDNNIDGNALRPGDVIPTRKGLSIEIGNTDAEGRVVLADALALADEERPDLIIDCATLTGAARVALGPDLPAVFTADDDLAARLAHHGGAQADPVWRLPLWSGYREMIDSPIADINNAGDSPLAGAITAALFLQDFVTRAKCWVHVDLFGWNQKSRPGRPVGGEAQAMRALYAMLRERYG